MIRFLHLLFAVCCKKSTRGPFVHFGQTVAVVLWSLNVLIAGRLEAQYIDTFDRPGEKFSLWRSDCRAVMAKPSRPEPGVETIEASFGQGSYVHLVYPIDPCSVVDDLTASLRIRCAHNGIRIAFRIVYPNSGNAATTDPVTSLVFGTPTDSSGRWSTSTVRQIVKSVESQQTLLRAKHGPQVDLSNPFVDAIVLDIYRYAGGAKLQVDDLQIEGIVPALVQPGAFSDGAGRGTAELDPNLPIAERLRLMQSTVPRWIQYYGESLDYLQTLGFNGVVASRADDPLLAEQASRTPLAIVAPPPTYIPDDSLKTEYAHVQAWMLGLELNESGLDSTRRQVSTLARFPQSLARPTIGEALEMYGSYSRLTDWLAVPTPHATQVNSFDETDQILRSESRSLAGRSMPLTSMVTQLPVEWMEQKAILQNNLGGETIGLPDFDYLQTRLSVYRAMMRGTRGWIFRSAGPLDRGDITTMARTRGFKAINSEIDLFSPWIQANQTSWKPVSTDSSSYRASVLTTPNSQLVLMVANGSMDQICAVSPDVDSVRLALPLSGQNRRVFRITHGSLESLREEPRVDAVYVTINKPSLIEQIVTVVDPKPIEYLRTQLANRASTLMESRIDTANQVLQLAQMSFVAQRLPSNHPHWEQIQRGQTLYREALHAMSRSNVVVALQRADESISVSQRVLRSSWEEAVAQFGSFQSSPLVSSPMTLPLHWELHRVLSGRPWQSLPIPGIPAKDWQALQQQGWRVDSRLQDLITTFVSVDASGPNGSSAIVLSAAPATSQPVPTGYGGAAMRLTSATISAPLGAMVQIQGKIRIDSPANEPQSGLLICDSLGGESMGQLLTSAETNASGWRDFALFRMVTSDKGFRIYFETRGAVHAQVSDLRIEMIMPTTSPSVPVRALIESESPYLPSVRDLNEANRESNATP